MNHSLYATKEKYAADFKMYFNIKVARKQWKYIFVNAISSMIGVCLPFLSSQLKG